MKNDGYIESEEEFDLREIIKNILDYTFDPSFLNLNKTDDDKKQNNFRTDKNDQKFDINEEDSQYLYYEYENFFIENNHYAIKFKSI